MEPTLNEKAFKDFEEAKLDATRMQILKTFGISPSTTGSISYDQYNAIDKAMVAYASYIKNNIEGKLKLLVRVPSSPVMSFEEFEKKHCNIHPGLKGVNQIKFEGYLIGTRSIVPEIDWELLGESMRQFMDDFYHHHPDSCGAEWKDILNHLKDNRNWLRSQINK